MSGIRSYDLGGNEVQSLVSALAGNEQEKTKWLDKLGNWLNHRNRQLEILRLAEQWLREYALKTGVHIDRHEWATEEDNLTDWVYYQMEYTGGLCWDKESQKVIVHKYASSRPLLSEENLGNMLDYITNRVQDNTLFNKELAQCASTTSPTVLPIVTKQ